MRIAFVLSSLRLSGGVLLASEYANRLAARGHTVFLAAPRDTLDAEVAAALLPAIAVVEARRPLPSSPSPSDQLQLALALAAAIPPVDIVMATHTPTVVPVLMASWRRRCARAWLYMDYPEMFRRRPAERLLLEYAPGWFPTILPISAPLAAAARPRACGRVRAILPGLIKYRLLSPPSVRTPPPRRRIFYLGDDRPRKGLQDFLAACLLLHRQRNDVQPVVASKSACRIEAEFPLELWIRPTDEELVALYQGCDLFVSASWGEGLGYPPLEAMACATPAVITDSHGVRDFAVDGWNCLLTPPRNPLALAAAMSRALDDLELAERLRRHGLETAARYDWDRAAGELEAELTAAVLAN